MPRAIDWLRRPPPAASPAVAGFRRLGLAVALAACFAAAPAFADTATAIHGTVHVGTQGSTRTVTTGNGTGTRHSAINWTSFGVAPGTTTHFAQPVLPTGVSTSINRVMGNDPSGIYGTLTSNGRLVLVNPYGITVGAGAVVDTAGFTASNVRMSDGDAIAGRLRFGLDEPDGPGTIRVNGRIVARGEDVVLISRDIEVGASGVVKAEDGTVILAAGKSVEITARGLEGIHFEVANAGAKAVNLGKLRGDAVGIFADRLTHSGRIIARTAANVGGKVVLLADDITVAPGYGTPGSIDASGATAGGTILIGGDAAGAAAIAGFDNARRVTIAAGSQIRADATEAGDGGKVVVWGWQQADVHGALSARGGPGGGNGGTVTTASRRLQFGGSVDVSAPAGTAGTWRIGARSIDVERDDDDVDLLDYDDDYYGSGRTSISADAIEAVLDQGGTVVLGTGAEAIGDEVGGDGRVRILDTITKNTAGAATLEMRAHTDVLVQAAVGASNDGGPLNLVFDADGERSIQVLADIDLRGGSMTADDDAPPIVFGEYGSDALTIRARLLSHRFELRQNLQNSDLVLGSGAVLDWFGGTRIANGHTRIESGSVLNIRRDGASSDPESHVLSNHGLDNFGTVLFEDGAGDLLLQDGSEFRNARTAPGDTPFAMGTFAFEGAGTVGGSGGTFVNEGLLFKLGEGTATLDATSVQFQFRPQSSVFVNEGTLLLAKAQDTAGFFAADVPAFHNQGFLTVMEGATFAAPQYTLVNEGNILGAGTIVAETLRNEGFIQPFLLDGSNVLTIEGNFEQTETGQLFLTVTSPTQHDRLHIVGGTATLGGEIFLQALDAAGYAQGSTFDLITGADAVNGTATMSPEDEFSGAATGSGFRATAQRSRIPAAAPPPSEGGTPAPAPSSGAPASPPADTPAGRIVDLLGGQVTLAQAQNSIVETQGAVTQGLEAPEDDRAGPRSNGDICLR